MKTETFEYLVERVLGELHRDVVAQSTPTVAMAVSTLMARVRQLHRHLETEDMSPGLEVIYPLHASGFVPQGDVVTSVELLTGNLARDRKGTVIHISRAGTIRVEFREPGEGIPDNCVRYVFQPFEKEEVSIPGASFGIPSLPGGVSPFGIPYFRDLREALASYYVDKAQKSRCDILLQAWGADGTRMVFANHPEVYMRRSLHDYLSTRLRDVEPVVLQEQNVNESEPVDIRIQWLDQKRIALIEVKWTGDSWSDDLSHTLPYRDKRARDGYTQLSDYVKSQDHTLPGHVIRAHLVVFDARRRGLNAQNGVATSSDPSYYRNRALNFEDLLGKDDRMEDPQRYFLEPAAENNTSVA